MMHAPINAAAKAIRYSPGLFVSNMGRIWGDYLYGSMHNIDSFRKNAFIVSALIQVSSRIYVANKTAIKTRNTPEAPFRYLEAVKTTFREAMAWVLSYSVLRYMQRIFTDVFRNWMCVASGVDSKPTMFNAAFKTLFNNTTDHARPQSVFAGLGGTLKRSIEEWRSYMTGNQRRFNLTPLTSFFPDRLKPSGVILHDEGLRRLEKSRLLSGLVDKVVGISRESFAAFEKKPDLLRAMRLKTFFQWMPLLLGSIPTILLSGFVLERFTQQHAEPMAEAIAKNFSKKRYNPKLKDMYRPKVEPNLYRAAAAPIDSRNNSVTTAAATVPPSAVAIPTTAIQQEPQPAFAPVSMQPPLDVAQPVAYAQGMVPYGPPAYYVSQPIQSGFYSPTQQPYAWGYPNWPGA